MAFLTGPNTPLSLAMSQLSRSNRDEPFGAFEGIGPARSPMENALMQLCGLMNRFMGIMEMMMAQPMRHEDDDDFMRGWGEPGGDIES